MTIVETASSAEHMMRNFSDRAAGGDAAGLLALYAGPMTRSTSPGDQSVDFATRQFVRTGVDRLNRRSRSQRRNDGAGHRHRRSGDDISRSFNVAAGSSPFATFAFIVTWLTDFCADLPKIDVPALVIHGTDANTAVALPYVPLP